MPHPWETLAGSSTRAPRKLETREMTQARRVWAPAALLPDPEPQDGYVFKWVRASVRNEADGLNFQKSRREGWEPCRVADHPEMANAVAPGIKSEFIEVGGLVLCKMAEEMVLDRRRYYAERNLGELDAAENQYMQDDGDARLGKFSKVTSNARRTLGGFRRQ